MLTLDRKPNKSRLIFLLRYLMDHTDEDHPLSIYDMIDIMEQNGYGTVTRKTATDDIQALKDNGFSIYIDDSGTSNQYFYDGRPFQTAELKLLLDAVDAASFIGPAQTAALNDKLLSEASVYERERLQLEHAAYPKRISNTKILYITDLVQQAMKERKKIRFQYADIDENLKRVLRHDGAFYVVSPYHTYQNDGCYYLLGYYDLRQDINTFRMEFMEIPQIIDEEAVPEPADFHFSEYLRSTFKMFDGETQMVTLEADNRMMRKVVDKFGLNITVRPIPGNKFQTEVPVSVSETFFSWLFLYWGKIEVVAPQAVCQEYAQMLEKALEYSREKIK